MKKLLLTCMLALPMVGAVAADATLTDEQVGAAFKKADKNGDGTLSKAEARAFGITSKVFMTANPDKDGTLDTKEFAAAMAIRFHAANPDKDGTLDWKEARKAGVKSKKAFEGANPDKDGSLDLAEYVAALAE